MSSHSKLDVRDKRLFQIRYRSRLSRLVVFWDRQLCGAPLNHKAHSVPTVLRWIQYGHCGGLIFYLFT